MINIKTILTIFLFILFISNGLCQKKERVIYAVTDQNEELFIDVYPGARGASSILFVHGGGFEGGHPDGQRSFAEEMQNRGYNVFVISYRLLMKGRGFGCDIPTLDKLDAIRAGVEDAAKATSYLLENKNNFNLDPDQFYLAGSSAGAEVALQLVFNPFSHLDSATYVFPDNFRFKGVMSFAGALLDIRLVSPDMWVPLLLFHGTEDNLVPLGTAPHRFCKATDPGWMMFFGSQTIFDKAVEMDLPAEFHLYAGKGHEVANYMAQEFDIMDTFLKKSKQRNDWKPKLIEY